MNLKRRNQNGFTLVELLAVIAIIAILGIIAVPNVLNTLNNSKKATYNIMLKNIQVAGQELYDELEFAKSELFDYDKNGNQLNLVKINNNSITITLQGLVNNGFLKGTNNSKDNLENKNSKVILEPKSKKDIGMCNITITKVNVANKDKVCYKITDNSDNKICPKTEEYGNCFVED